MTGQTVDINYIAKVAGVSRSTVSRVLTNHKNVKPATALKVREAMIHCNYTPNALARGLVTGSINIIALVVSDITSPFYSEITAILTSYLRGKGYLLCLYDFGKDPNEQQDEDLQALLNYGFAGVIITDARNEPAFGTVLKSVHCPVVLLNRYIDTVQEYDAIMADNFLGGYLATRHLLELGHRRIAMLTGTRKSTSAIDRHRGYLKALEEYGIAADPALVSDGDLRYDAGYKFADALLARDKADCTAIFAGNDLMALGILGRCRELKIRVPEDLSLVGFDGIPLAGTPVVNLTTVQQPYIQMAELASEQIVSRIKGDAGTRQRIILVPELVVRGTTGPCP